MKNTTTTTNAITATNTTKLNKEGKTMKNTSTLRNRIIAGMLAIITTYSALAVTASAESIPASAGDNLLTVGSHTATAEDNIKEKTNNDGGLDIKGPKKTMIDDSTFNTPKVGNGGLGGPSKRK